MQKLGLHYGIQPRMDSGQNPLAQKQNKTIHAKNVITVGNGQLINEAEHSISTRRQTAENLKQASNH